MKILKDSLIYLAGEMFAKALPFLLLPYLTRRLGAAGFGDLSFYQTVFSLLAIVFGMSQDGAVTRYYYVYGHRNLHNVVCAGYAYTVLAAACVLVWAWLSQSAVLASVTAAAAAQTVLGTQLAVRQCQKQAAAYTAIQSASSCAVVLLTVLLLEGTAGEPVSLRFAAVFGGNAAVAAAAFVLLRRGSLKTDPRKIRQALPYILAFGLPLLLHHAGGYVKGQFDRILIYQSQPAALLGVYSAGYQLAGILGVLLMAANKAAVPHYYQAIRQGRIDGRRVRRWAAVSLLAVPLPAALARLLPESLFAWFLGAGYEGVRYYTCLFLIGFGLTLPYYLLVNYLFYHAQNRRIAAVSALSALGYLAVLSAAARFGTALMPLAMIAGNALVLPVLYREVARTDAEGSLKTKRQPENQKAA